MADRMPGIIQIGGTISDPHTIAALITAIEEDVAGFEWGDTTSPEDILDEMVAISEFEGGDWLELRDVEANLGEFYEIQKVCLDHDIPYDRRSEAKYEYDSELAWWRPGMAYQEVRLADHDGSIVVPRIVLESANNAGISLQSIIDDNTPPPLPVFRMICTREQVEALLELE